MSYLSEQFRRKWIHVDDNKNIQEVGQDAYQVSMTAMLSPENLENSKLISFFTPIYMGIFCLFSMCIIRK